MKTTSVELLTEVFCEVLERQTFMFGNPIPMDEIRKGVDSAFRTTISFTGSVRGTLALLIPLPLCAAIAANSVGAGEVDPGETTCVEDAVMELLNVTCGRLLTAIAGEGAVFHLGLPVISRLETEGWMAALDDPNTTAMLVEDRPILLNLTLKQGVS